MNYLAFDLGGSSGKLILGSLENGVLSLKTIHRFDNHPVEVDGNLYWDLFRIKEELFAGIRKAIQMTDDRIAGIGFDSFCNDYVLVSENGTVLAPVYCYRDERTRRCQDRMYSVMSREELYWINGNQMALFNTLNQLHAMKQEGFGWQMDHAGKALFISDYFVYLLTGNMQTEYTTASVTQMFDWEKCTWANEILRKYGIPKELFAPIRLPGTLAGKTREPFNQSTGTRGFPVYTVCQHDTASAFLASAGGDTGIISTGTWCIAGVETEKPVIIPEGFVHNVANEGGFPGAHHRLLKNVMGTWILQEMLRDWNAQGKNWTFENLEEMAALHQDSDPILFDVDEPDFYQPGDMVHKVKARIKKQTGKRAEDPGMLVDAVYQSLAVKYAEIFREMEYLTGREIKRINMLGGGIHSDRMCALTARACKKPVLAGPDQATAYGNILAQMAASGQIRNIDEGRTLMTRNMIRKCYEPE